MVKHTRAKSYENKSTQATKRKKTYLPSDTTRTIDNSGKILMGSFYYLLIFMKK